MMMQLIFILLLDNIQSLRFMQQSPTQGQQLQFERSNYVDIPKTERQHYQLYAKNIWNLALLHQTSSKVQQKCKEFIRKSYVSSKSNTYSKTTYKYGSESRQKIAVYSPLQKSQIELKVILFTHGGDLVTGAEECFEYLAKELIQRGYILVVFGFRLLSDAKCIEALQDIHFAYVKALQVLPAHGANLTNITMLTFEDAGAFVLYNLTRYQPQYQNHVRSLIAIASSWEWQPNKNYDKNIFSSTEKLNISQEIRLITGNVLEGESAHTFQQNKKYSEIFKMRGVQKVNYTVVSGHDHYDLITNEYLILNLIRECELDNVPFHTELSNLLLFDQPANKERLFEKAKDPIFRPVYNASLNEIRERTIKQFQLFNSDFRVKDLTHGLKFLFSNYEIFAPVATAVVVKTITHFSGSVGTILQNGTAIHQKYLDLVDQGKMVCAFGMTELGGGNNIGDAGTTATYDHPTKSFIFNNKTPQSMKFWPANLAVHANYVVLFASTFVNGKNEGINSFVIPLRNEKRQPYKGVMLKDIGMKLGLNGIDNGMVVFENYSVPLECLLNKFNNVDENGIFTSQLKGGIQERFFKTIEKLLLGRICIAAGCLATLKGAIYIALTYSRNRFGVAFNSKTQLPILNYQLQQNAIVPIVAKTLVLNFFLNYSKELFCSSPNDIQLPLIINIAKTFIGDYSVKFITILRERVGGQGMISNNRFAQYLSAANGGITGQGDNKVLVNKVAKDLIKLISTAKVPSPQADTSITITSLHQFDHLDTLLSFYQFREAKTFEVLFGKFQSLQQERKNMFEIMMFHGYEEVNDYVYAYGERHAFQQAIRNVRTLKEKEHIFMLANMLKIVGLEQLQTNLGFYVIQGVIEPSIAQQIRQKLNAEIKIGATFIEYILANWNIPTHALYAPIAGDYVRYFSEDHQGEVLHAKL